MPKYLVEMHDGRKFQVEADSQPTEDEVMAHLGGSQPSEAATQAPPVERGGLTHPLTSFVAPELEAVRGKVNDALATPHGTPIMARSRTGALYPSETGTGAVNAGKSFARGAITGSNGLIDQAEGATSPVGAVVGAVGAIGPKTIGRAAIRTTASAGDFLDPDLIGVISPRGAKVVKIAQRLRTAMDAPSAGGGASVPSRSLESTARVLDPVEVPQPQATSGLSSADRAQLAKQGYSPELIDKIATQAQAGGTVAAPKGGFIRAGRIEPVPSHAPTSPDMVPVGGEAAYNAAHAQAAPVAQTQAPLLPNDQIRRDLMDPEMVRKAMEMQQSAQAARLQQPRVDIGAERVGRANGMTKEAVRAQTDPILGEARGEASPILPQKALNNIIDAMKALPREGGAREAYVQAATSGKAQWQIENIRRTLEHLGLLIPTAATVAPSVRDMLLQKMRAGVTGQQTGA